MDAETETAASALLLASGRVLVAKTVDAGVQAAPSKLRDAGTDPAESATSGTQTDEADRALQPLETLSSLSFDGWDAADAELDFLRRAADVMNAALALDAVAAPDALLAADDAGGDDDLGCIHSASLSFVQPEDVATGAAADAPRALSPHLILPCAAVSWSCTGSMLAAGYGCTDHVGWCKHRAGVCIYNFYGGGPKRPESGVEQTITSEAQQTVAAVGSYGGVAPAVVFETSCCVCSVAFHPEKPGVLAAGTFNGEVLVWDLNREDEQLLYRSKSDDYMHREPVCSVAWVWDAATRVHLLVTASSEGKVLMWSLEQGLTYPVQGFLPAALPVVQPRFGGPAEASAGSDSAGAGGTGGGGDSGSDDDARVGTRARRGGGGSKGHPSQAAIAGVASIAFPLMGRNAAAFYVGAENGGLYKCRVQAGAAGMLLPPAQAGSNKLVKPGAIAGADSALPWDVIAAAAVSRVPQAERAKVVRAIERHARDTGNVTVTLPVMFDARPDPRALFPNPVAFSYQPHSGAVLSLASSPFHRNLFASAGLDGRLCIFSALSATPLMTLLSATRSTHVCSVTSVAWSHVRPMVLAAACGDGNVYVYDLYVATGRPTVVLRADGSVASALGGSVMASAPPPPALSLPAIAASRPIAGGGGGKAVHAVSFNPKQRRLIATGDSEGIVRVYKLSWRTASAQQSEELLLRRFVDSAVHDGDGPPDVAAAAAAEGAGTMLADEPNSISSFLRSVASKRGGGAELI
jgi:WD repeat-containing protein 34